MEERVEDIIRKKKYFELTKEERELIKDWASSEVEFDQLKAVFISVDGLNTNSNESLNPTIKQRLDVRFKEKYDQERLIWYNKLWLFLWPRDVSIVRKPLLQLATVGVIIAIATPFLFVENPAKQALALNEKSVEVEEHQTEPDKTIEKPNKTNTVNKEAGVEEKKRAEETERKVEQDGNFNNTQVNRIEDLEMSALKDKRVDQVQIDQNRQLYDELSDNEHVVVSDESATEEKPRSEQQVFAGAVSKVEVDRLSSGAGTDADLSSAKQVDTKETIGLLTALY